MLEVHGENCPDGSSVSEQGETARKLKLCRLHMHGLLFSIPWRCSCLAFSSFYCGIFPIFLSYPYLDNLEKNENSEEKYKVVHVVILDNKVIFDVEIASGKSFSGLLSKKNEIENAFKGICILEQIKFSNRAKVTIITKI